MTARLLKGTLLQQFTALHKGVNEGGYKQEKAWMREGTNKGGCGQSRVQLVIYKQLLCGSLAELVHTPPLQPTTELRDTRSRSW